LSIKTTIQNSQIGAPGQKEKTEKKIVGLSSSIITSILAGFFFNHL